MTATTIDAEQLNCPLCGYDLRGLPENRCPECGHAFDPEELRRAKLERRDWFFEHAKRRRVRAFVLTSLASFRPFFFWKRVRAADEIVPRRLWTWAAAWLVASLLLFSAGLTAATLIVLRDQTAGFSRLAGRFPPGAFVAPSFASSSQQVLRRSSLGDDWWLAAVILAWPPLTVAAARCFSTTLRRASIRSGHLWRCTLYAMPIAVLPCVAFAVASLFWEINRFNYFNAWPNEVRHFLPAAPDPPRILWELSMAWHVPPLSLLVLLLATLLSTGHFVVAHVCYLRLPQAATQATLIQVVTWLSLLCLMHFGAPG